MLRAKDYDLMLFHAQQKIEKIIAEYMLAYAERSSAMPPVAVEVEDGEDIYGKEGRFVQQDSGEAVR